MIQLLPNLEQLFIELACAVGLVMASITLLLYLGERGR